MTVAAVAAQTPSVFMLYAVVAGTLAGLAFGGRLRGLGGFRLRWVPLAVGGLLVQVALFSAPVAATAIGDAGPALYVASTLAVFAVVLRNIDVPGLAIVAAGAASNLAAILVNGGFMPASPTALAAVGTSIGSDYSNSSLVAAPALLPLTDIFAMPAWLPFANIFSIGDVVIGIGVTVAIVARMRVTDPTREARPTRSMGTNPAAVPVGTSLQRADPLVPRGH